MSDLSPTELSGGIGLVRLGHLLVQKLYVCLKTLRIHEDRNVTSREAAEELRAAVAAAHQADGGARLGLLQDAMSLNHVRLRSDVAGQEAFRYVHDLFLRHRVGTILFSDGLDADEAQRFCHLLIDSPGGGEDPFAELLGRLREESIAGVDVEELEELPHEIPDVALRENVKQRSVSTYFKAIEISRQVLTASDPTKINFRGAKRVIQNMVDTIEEEEFILLSLTSIKNYDEYTFNHSTNVAVYAIALGQKLGLDRRSLCDLGMAGLFHDIGKTRVPKEILNKPSMLEEHEWEEMKSHTVRGAEILIRSKRLNDTVIRNILVAFEHHLNLDLGGYPDLTDRRDLNLFSKVVAIADCFDALTTPRIYRNTSYNLQEALAIMMEGRGNLYDPTLLKVFVNCIGIHPIGSVVELDSGELGVVYRGSDQAGRLDRPVIKVFADLLGNRVSERMLNLAGDGKENARIVRTLDPGDYFDSIQDYLDVL